MTTIPLYGRWALNAPARPTDGEDWIAAAIRLTKGHDGVIVSRLPVARQAVDAIRAAVPTAKLIFNTVDLHYLREMREGQVLDNPDQIRRARDTKAAELAAIRACDATLVVSRYERDVLAELVPSAQVWVMPVRRDLPLGQNPSVAAHAHGD